MLLFRRVSFLITALCCLFAIFLAVVGSTKHNHRSTSQPNIVFLFTDDQDVHMNSLDYMPLLKQYITDQGTAFPHHYCTVSLCCPSRASLWTGKAAHNTNVTDLSPPYGLFSPLPKKLYHTQLLILTRRISCVRPKWVQRRLVPSLDAVRWLQHLLRGKTLQLPRCLEL